MTDDAPGVELAIRAQPLLPMQAGEARQMMQAYQELTASILEASDRQRVGDREFVKRSGFQKLAAAYGVSTEIVTSIVETVQRGEHTILVARVVARATHPSGRHADGDGTCASNETRFQRGDQRMEHNLVATATTRAINRAVSNLIAFGSVSAEEAEEAGASTGSPGGAPAWAAPVELGTAAEGLHKLLENAGVPQEGRHKIVTQVGNFVLDNAGDGFPRIVLDTVLNLSQALFIARAENNLDAEEQARSEEPPITDAEAEDLAEAEARGDGSEIETPE